MKNRVGTILMTVLVAIAAAGSASAGTNSRSRQEQKAAPGRQGESAEQAYIVREVRHELAMLPYYSLFDWMEFKVEDGTVILGGQVTRPTLSSDAERVVARIKGVDKVVNQIEVLPLSPMDDRIRLAVARAIYNFNGPLYRYGMMVVPQIHIIVKHGNVTLKGVVNSQTDSNYANVKANGVANVFSVKNELQVVRD